MSASPVVRRWQVAPLLSLTLLVGIWGDRQLFHRPPQDPDAYHARVFAIAESFPYRVGNWVGTNLETPASALSLLKPNFLRARRFRNSKTAESADLLIVQCRDARDMGGHYPPACYPAHGWVQRSAEKRSLRVGAAEIPVSVYRFTIESVDRYDEIVVYNFFVRPDGAIESGLSGVRSAAADSRAKVLGAAQLQVLFDEPLSSERMDEIFQELILATFPIIDAVRGGAE